MYLFWMNKKGTDRWPSSLRPEIATDIFRCRTGSQAICRKLAAWRNLLREDWRRSKRKFRARWLIWPQSIFTSMCRKKRCRKDDSHEFFSCKMRYFVSTRYTIVVWYVFFRLALYTYISLSFYFPAFFLLLHLQIKYSREKKRGQFFRRSDEFIPQISFSEGARSWTNNNLRKV